MLRPGLFQIKSSIKVRISYHVIFMITNHRISKSTSSESTNISHSTEKVDNNLSTIHTVEDKEILSTFNLTYQYTWYQHMS
jgi:hypothetical protein